ncbi:MAG: hypothetical protein Q9205_007676, partial [Flavoplaca limonia]
NAILDAVANASQEAGIQQKILQNEDSGSAKTVQKKHYANIENTLSDFLMKQESVLRGFKWWDTVRAVVISGDASELGLQGLRGCVDNALDQHKDQMRDSIDPLYVEAMGAAQRGQHQVLNPRFLDDMAQGDDETKAARAQHLGMHAYQTARPFHVLNHRRNDVDLPSAYKYVWQLGPDILYWSHVPVLLILRHAHILIGTTTCLRNLETSIPRIRKARDHHVSRNRLEPTEAPAVDLSAAFRRDVKASIAPICWQAGCSSSPQVLATGTCLVARCPAACGGSTITTTPTTTNTTNTLRLQLVQSPDGVVAATKSYGVYILRLLSRLLCAQTMSHNLWHRPRTAEADGTGHANHKVSFSDSSKRDSSRPSASRTNSHTSSPRLLSPRGDKDRDRPRSQQPWSDNRAWQRVNRQSEALWQFAPPDISPQPRPFLIYHDSFLNLLGPSPSLSLLISDPRAPYFHEAGVFHPATNTLFVTSNQIPDTSPDAVTTSNKTIVITKIEFFSPTDFTRDKVRCPERNYMANGGSNFRDGIVLCAQGSLREPSGLIYMEAKRPHKTITLVNNYHGRPFNSPNDVVTHSDGSVWFTDPIYGYEQGFRPKPQLPQHVYRFDPSTGDIRVVADGFGRPNGICFGPNEETCYITDTDVIHGDGTKVHSRAATVYAYSVYWSDDQPYLTNRRVFAYADTGAPDGIKCDVYGNVYAGCGDGIN